MRATKDTMHENTDHLLLLAGAWWVTLKTPDFSCFYSSYFIVTWLICMQAGFPFAVSWRSMWFCYIDPRGRPVVITIFAHVIRRSVRTYVRTSQNFKIKRQSLPAGIMGWPSGSLSLLLLVWRCESLELAFLESKWVKKLIKDEASVIINDPLGQAQRLASSKHCFRLKYVFEKWGRMVGRHVRNNDPLASPQSRPAVIVAWFWSFGTYVRMYGRTDG